MSATDNDRAAANRATVERLWETLYRRDFDGVGALFTDDGRYTDVFTPDEDVAVGPAQIAARLRLGLEPLDDIKHHSGTAVAEGDVAMTEHAEEWFWSTGERFVVRFASVHEVDADGRIVRWFDYPALQGLLNAAPAWWIEHIMNGYAGGPAPDAGYIEEST
jgi:ketosteroid isomerase-like protein